jgi:hypothetical protein
MGPARATSVDALTDLDRYPVPDVGGDASKALVDDARS